MDGTQDEDVAVPHQLEPLFLNLPKGVRKQASVGALIPNQREKNEEEEKGTFQQRAGREECEDI